MKRRNCATKILITCDQAQLSYVGAPTNETKIEPDRRLRFSQLLKLAGVWKMPCWFTDRYRVHKYRNMVGAVGGNKSLDPGIQVHRSERNVCFLLSNVSRLDKLRQLYSSLSVLSLANEIEGDSKNKKNLRRDLRFLHLQDNVSSESVLQRFSQLLKSAGA